LTSALMPSASAQVPRVAQDDKSLNFNPRKSGRRQHFRLQETKLSLLGLYLCR